MSTKRLLARAIEEMPESLSIEEAVARLYRLFKLKQTLSPASSPAPSEPRHVAARSRVPTLHQALGLLQTERPPPSDAEVEEMLNERRMSKLG